MDSFSDIGLSRGQTDWVVTKSLDEEHISEYAKDLISSGSFINGERMYTKRQLIQMFRIGYQVRKNDDIRKIWASPGTSMRQMDVGDVLSFPYEKWNAARSSASKLKKQFGCVFRVRKMSPGNEIGDIEVVRLV